jgi:Fe-S cluster assembly protein SufD
MQETNTYLADFEQAERDLGRMGSAALQRLRKAAIARFADLGFPTLRDEEWRFTPVTPITKVPFQINCSEDERPPSATLGLPPGVLVCSLAEALEKYPNLVEPHLARYADYKSHAFTALNTAFLHDGAFVYVPKGTVLEQPLHLDFAATAASRPIVRHRRCLIVVGDNSQVTILESYHGLPGTVYFTNAVTEIVVGPGAMVDHYKLQQEGLDAFHVATMQVQQQRASRFSSHSVGLGGALVRNEVNAVLGAEGCECILNGVYLATGQQLIDNHTVIDHAKPHCESHELYKGILDGKARGVFNGKIYVRQDAQKTDAKQTNQTLLLSDDATINTKPQLEIYADDVKCTHGATVGQLDEEATFYLRSRGIGRAEARNLLTFAFANDVVSRIKIDSLRDRLEQTLLAAQHLPKNEAPQERP